MEAVLVVARHPHVPTTGPCGVEQAQKPEPARSGGLPHASDALGSSGVAEAQQQRRCVAASGQGLKPSNNAHKVGLHRIVGISPNVGRMAAVIDDHATYRVGGMGGGRIEVATRDDGGAKGVTTFTARDKQLHHFMRYGGRWGPPVVPRTPAAHAREWRDSEAGEWLIRQ